MFKNGSNNLKAGRGRASQGESWLGPARHGESRLGLARPDKSRLSLSPALETGRAGFPVHGRVWLGAAGHGVAGHGKAWQGEASNLIQFGNGLDGIYKARLGMARRVKAWLGRDRQGGAISPVGSGNRIGGNHDAGLGRAGLGVARTGVAWLGGARQGKDCIPYRFPTGAVGI